MPRRAGSWADNYFDMVRDAAGRRLSGSCLLCKPANVLITSAEANNYSHHLENMHKERIKTLKRSSSAALGENESDEEVSLVESPESRRRQPQSKARTTLISSYFSSHPTAKPEEFKRALVDFFIYIVYTTRLASTGGGYNSAHCTALWGAASEPTPLYFFFPIVINSLRTIYAAMYF